MGNMAVWHIGRYTLERIRFKNRVRGIIEFDMKPRHVARVGNGRYFYYWVSTPRNGNGRVINSWDAHRLYIPRYTGRGYAVLFHKVLMDGTPWLVVLTWNNPFAVIFKDGNGVRRCKHSVQPRSQQFWGRILFSEVDPSDHFDLDIVDEHREMCKDLGVFHEISFEKPVSPVQTWDVV